MWDALKCIAVEQVMRDNAASMVTLKNVLENDFPAYNWDHSANTQNSLSVSWVSRTSTVGAGIFFGTVLESCHITSINLSVYSSVNISS